MTKKNMILITILFFIGIIAVVIVISQDNDFESEIIVEDSINDYDYHLMYDDEDDIYYVVLPENTSLNSLKIVSKYNLYINDSKIVEQAPFEDVKVGEDFKLTIKGLFRDQEIYMCFLQTERTATVFIETKTGSIEKIHENKEYVEDMATTILNTDGDIEYIGLGTISGRGNATWNGAKKSYNIAFDDKLSILGFENINKYCLIGNYSDASLLRNATVYYAAREIGIKYTSNMAFITLYINGNYYGLYTICTKQNYQNDLGHINAVFELTTNRDGADFTTETGSGVRLYYGSETYTKNIIEKFETALAKETPFNKLNDYIDIESFVDKYLIEEVLFNSDGNLYSQYFSIDENGIICAINAWDYDNALGNMLNLSIAPTNILLQKRGSVCAQWYDKLYQYEEYQKKVYHNFLEKFSPQFMGKIETFIDKTSEEIFIAWGIDKFRWRNEDPYRTDEQDRSYDDYSGYFNSIKIYMEERYDFLKDYFSDPNKYCCIQIETPFTNGADTININILKGSYIEIPDNLVNWSNSSYKIIGWHTEDGISYEDIKVNSDMTLIAEIDSEIIELIGWNKVIDVIQKYFLEFVIIGIFGIVFLTVLVYSYKRCNLK